MDGKLKKVYLNEYNILMDNAIFLPLVSGLLQAYAQTKAAIRQNYEFMPFIFLRDKPKKIISQYQNPSVAAFSASVWNINLSLVVARQVKGKFPECLIVFGGPQVPKSATKFLEQHPFINVTVRGDGELAFADILVRFLETRDFSNIPGISYRQGISIIHNDMEYPLAKDLDIFPSPYLEGLFDQLLDSNMDFQAIVETNRGCPFKCSFCFWSQGNKHFRFYSLERVRGVINWFGINKIRYSFCADSNFGMIKRDLEIASYVVETKAKYGFPEKFRACYGKNVEENIFKIGKLLTEHELIKGVSISTQSNNPQVLQNINRENIKMSVYKNLQDRYSKNNIPTYTEILPGLPGETYKSYVSGLEEILEAAPKSQIIIYPVQVLPNTELADPGYQEKFKIKTIRLPLNETHASIHKPSEIIEYEERVIATESMPLGDWRRVAVISWVMQLLHDLKLGFYISAYLFDCYHVRYTDFYEYLMLKASGQTLRNEIRRLFNLSVSIQQGKPHSQVLRDFGPIYWEPEEKSYLRILTKRDAFYKELFTAAKEYLESLDVPYDERQLGEVVEYQKARLPSLQNYNGDKKAFAKQVVVYGRKSDQMLLPEGG